MKEQVIYWSDKLEELNYDDDCDENEIREDLYEFAFQGCYMLNMNIPGVITGRIELKEDGTVLLCIEKDMGEQRNEDM